MVSKNHVIINPESIIPTYSYIVIRSLRAGIYYKQRIFNMWPSCLLRNILWVMFVAYAFEVHLVDQQTLPPRSLTASSPLKSYRNPIGKDQLVFPSHLSFRGKLAVQLLGCRFILLWSYQHKPGIFANFREAEGSCSYTGLNECFNATLPIWICRVSPQPVGIHWFFFVYWFTVLVSAQILQKVRNWGMICKYMAGSESDDVRMYYLYLYIYNIFCLCTNT